METPKCYIQIYPPCILSDHLTPGMAEVLQQAFSKVGIDRHVEAENRRSWAAGTKAFHGKHMEETVDVCGFIWIVMMIYVD